ncbi:hypothetical protein C7445_10255 [Alicyclobacillus sacchari]|uniref:Uncharacterized protein n=1 Tax=Alicyclobacillus sacchari TaxID=392010 RepID=A0A4R8LS88_9BACL|nr:hypothetical protein [Alicyclobacillus sacchari]TDY50503.1 hypothetical protein C7445_10255 [Alicyclobacillus sacchari]
MRGFLQWLREGMTSANGIAVGTSRQRPSTSSSSASAEADGAAEAIAVLRDLYTEFDEKHKELAKRIERLERILGAMTPVQSVAGLTCDDLPARAASEAVTMVQETRDETKHLRIAAGATSEEVYFSILDMLNTGASHGQIRAALGVTDEQIHVVESLLAGDPARRKD